MKILYLSVPYRLSNAKVKIGGGEISNRILLEQLANNNSVTVLSVYGSGIWKKDVNGVKVLDFSTRFKLFSPFSVIVAKIFSKILFNYYACKLKPDIILCGPSTVAVSVSVSKKLKVPAGCFIRAFENFFSENKKDSQFKQILQKMIYGDNYSKSVNELDFLLPNSKYMLERCKKEFTCKKYHVVYPPIAINESELRCHREVKNIYMVSNMEHKGFSIFKQLSEEFSHINFFAVGVPNIDGTIKVTDNLYYEGWQVNPESFIAKSDLVLVPSLWAEPFGRISVEALLFGRMVLVSDKGGLPETVNYSSLLTVSGSHFSNWKDKIEDLIHNREKYISEYHLIRSSLGEYTLEYQADNLNNFLSDRYKNYLSAV